MSLARFSRAMAACNGQHEIIHREVVPDTQITLESSSCIQGMGGIVVVFVVIESPRDSPVLGPSLKLVLHS